jgi:hypothetical protein
MGSVDRPGQVVGPSAIYPEGSEVCSLRTGPAFLYCGPSGPWGRTVRSPDQRGSASTQSLYNCADCPAGVGGPSAGAKLVWLGTVCFWVFVLQTVRGLSPDSTDSQVADRPALLADSPRVLSQYSQGSGAPCCQVSDGPAKIGRLFGPRFSDSSDIFQTGKLVVTCTAAVRPKGADRPHVRKNCASCT